MDPTIFFSLAIVGLLALFFLGVPIFIAFCICNIIALYMLMGHLGFGMFVNSIFTTATSIPLLPLPLSSSWGRSFRARTQLTS